MENLGALEWLVILGAVVLVVILVGRTLNPGRPDDTFGLPQGDKPHRGVKSRKSENERAARGAAMQTDAIVLTEIQSAEVDRYIQAEKIINAIKVVRDASGASLRSSKEYVDARREELE